MLVVVHGFVRDIKRQKREDNATDDKTSNRRARALFEIPRVCSANSDDFNNNNGKSARTLSCSKDPEIPAVYVSTLLLILIFTPFARILKMFMTSG